MNKDILKSLSYGVYIVTTEDENRNTGCVANSVIQVTYDTIAISLNHENYTNVCIKKSKKFAISILGVDVDDNVIPIFGFQSGKDVDKCSQIKTIKSNGIDVVADAVGYIICAVVDFMETETHTIFLGKIIDGDILNEQIPMTYSYYHAVKKGKSPKNAPTYVEEKYIQE